MVKIEKGQWIEMSTLLKKQRILRTGTLYENEVFPQYQELLDLGYKRQNTGEGARQQILKDLFYKKHAEKNKGQKKVHL